MSSPLFAKKGKKKCDYVALSPGEIKKLKNNGYDPHDFKPRGSKDDLFKCKPAGKLVVKRKTKYLDPEKGEWVYPGENEIEDTGINIDDLPWEIAMKTIQEEMIIEFRVTGFSKPPSEVLQELKIKAFDCWQAGDIRVPNTLLKHQENGFRVRATQQVDDFEEAVQRLLERIYPLRKHLAKLHAECQLSCVFYLSGSERPVCCFSKEVLTQLTELGASLDIDVYYLADEEAA